jgi:hypothetical protein
MHVPEDSQSPPLGPVPHPFALCAGEDQGVLHKNTPHKNTDVNPVYACQPGGVCTLQLRSWRKASPGSAGPHAQEHVQHLDSVSW